MPAKETAFTDAVIACVGLAVAGVAVDVDVDVGDGDSGRQGRRLHGHRGQDFEFRSGRFVSENFDQHQGKTTKLDCQETLFRIAISQNKVC